MNFRLILLLFMIAVANTAQANVTKFQNKDEKIEFDLGDSPGIEINDGDEYFKNYARPSYDGSPSAHLYPAKQCDLHKCKLPDCKCSDDYIPNNTPHNETPQLIILSFQNAVNDNNFKLYTDLLDFVGKNPNGCNATASFYVSTKNTDFYDVQKLYGMRNEIGSNGVEEKTLEYWKDANVTEWCRQITDSKQILSHFAGVKSADIEGFRTPRLYMGGNTQFQAYEQCGIKYDATRVALNYLNYPNLMWPYSYEYQSMQDCPTGVCPNASFPGIWQVPLEALPDPRNVPCSELQGCTLRDDMEVYHMLMNAYNVRHSTNRAPMMVSISTEFMMTDYKVKGLKRFLLLATVLSDDTFVVSANQALNWVQHPEPIKVHPCPKTHCPITFPSAFHCDKPAPEVCANPKVCKYDKDRKHVSGGTKTAYYVTKMCAAKCPACYPVLGDPLGTKC